MARIISPCKGCNDRQFRCHSQCARYAEYKESVNTYNQKVYAAKEHEKMVTDFLSNQNARTKQMGKEQYQKRRYHKIMEVRE